MHFHDLVRAPQRDQASAPVPAERARENHPDPLSARAGPGPILSSVGQASPDGIEVNVANRRLQMCVIHNGGGEPALKQVTGPMSPGVHEVG
jgi:hypothetical protein